MRRQPGEEGGHVCAISASNYTHMLGLGGEGEGGASHHDGHDLLPVGNGGSVPLGGVGQKLCLLWNIGEEGGGGEI